MRSAAVRSAISRYPRMRSICWNSMTAASLERPQRPHAPLSVKKTVVSHAEVEVGYDDKDESSQEANMEEEDNDGDGDDEEDSFETPSPGADKDSTYEPSPVKPKRLTILQDSRQREAQAARIFKFTSPQCVQPPPPSPKNLEPVSSSHSLHALRPLSTQATSPLPKSQLNPFLTDQPRAVHEPGQRTLLLPLRPSPRKIFPPYSSSDPFPPNLPPLPTATHLTTTTLSPMSLSLKRRPRETPRPSVPGPYRIRPDESPRITPGEARRQRFLSLRNEQDRQLEHFERERQGYSPAKERGRGVVLKLGSSRLSEGRTATSRRQGWEECERQNQPRQQQNHHRGAWEMSHKPQYEASQHRVRPRRP